MMPSRDRGNAQDNRRAAAVSCPQRKLPVPANLCGRASPPPQRAQDAPPQPPRPAESVQPDGGPTQSASLPTPQAPVQDDATPSATASSGDEGNGDSEGKESLENPLVSMECFIFL
ncbi:hypothetical protein BRADI_1g78802v3 [Brachypodium distachyon]|uniref:Uncharacterized protein n=1 Tax=Brachypodium distachyon TaxID=15368 RepID=A0A0Q3HNG7_BRADI|nr:hypothetical protein BRADI_1g78802v3 [Brachypodium distachyon]PNT78410.1 hypothetical protein BRADI_1g78802v3 [Brachypodium distachyon]